MRLDMSHYKAVRELLSANRERTINGYDFERGFTWIQRGFLSQAPGHFIFGSFHEGELVAMACLIVKFPFPDTAYIGNVFYKPKFTKERIKVQASEEAYRAAVENGANKVITCVLEERFQSQWHLVTRYSEYLRDSFDVRLSHRIEAGTYPKEEWLQFILGYQTPQRNCAVREALFKKPTEKAS